MTNTNTYTAALAALRTTTDLTAYDDEGFALPTPETGSLDAAESRAVRALRAVSGVAAYVEDGEPADDVTTPFVDLISDTRHLADHLGVDWREVERRAERNYLDESVTDPS
ncbi:hypothetical protein ABIC28_005091 [Rhodococcus sp. PvR044]|uniref:hypothetical protein n=1 Tax=Rhodococcus sp. PvR044 TaxID=3156402 RepID=UPI003392DCC7